VTEVALASYVANSDSDGIDHGLKNKPMLAFALCYVAAHLALDLLDELQADAQRREQLERALARTLMHRFTP
jgi:hypothetical protein